MSQDSQTSRETVQTRRELIEALAHETRLSQNATDAIDELFCLSAGVNRTDARCMDLLDMHGGMTAGDLAERTGLTTGAITAVLDRLEGAGFVRRARDDADRRKVNVELTDEARRIAYAFYRPLMERGTARLRRFSMDELRAALEIIRSGRELSEGYAREQRALIPPRSPVESVRAVKAEAKAVKTEWSEEARALKRELKEQAKAVTREAKESFRRGTRR